MAVNPDTCQNVCRVLGTPCYGDIPDEVPLWSVQCDREPGHDGRHEKLHPSLAKANSSLGPWRWD